MKKTLLLMSLLLLTSLAAGCHNGILNRVSGSGNRQKQKRNVASFNSISYNGAFDVDIVCQQPVSLEIEGDDNILPLVGTEVSNNVLHIKTVSGPSHVTYQGDPVVNKTINGPGSVEKKPSGGS